MSEHAKPRDFVLPARTPVFVNRETGAAELCMSPATWDAYVREGKLPKPTLWAGKNPRWLWSDVMLFLTGRSVELTPSSTETAISKPREPFFAEAMYAPTQKRKPAPAKRRAVRDQAKRAQVFLLPSQPGNEERR
jgi:hypothetical protein